jgi:hypothetical protein
VANVGGFGADGRVVSLGTDSVFVVTQGGENDITKSKERWKEMNKE